MLEGFDPSQREEIKEWLDSQETQAILKMFRQELADIMTRAFANPDTFLIAKGRKEQLEWVIDQIQTAHKEE